MKAISLGNRLEANEYKQNYVAMIYIYNVYR